MPAVYRYKAPAKDKNDPTNIIERYEQGIKATLSIGPYRHQFILQHGLHGTPDKVVHWQSGLIVAHIENTITYRIGSKAPDAKELAQRVINRLVEKNGPDKVLKALNGAKVINEKLEKVE